MHTQNVHAHSVSDTNQDGHLRRIQLAYGDEEIIEISSTLKQAFELEYSLYGLLDMFCFLFVDLN